MLSSIKQNKTERGWEGQERGKGEYCYSKIPQVVKHDVTLLSSHHLGEQKEAGESEVRPVWDI